MDNIERELITLYLRTLISSLQGGPDRGVVFVTTTSITLDPEVFLNLFPSFTETKVKTSDGILRATRYDATLDGFAVRAFDFREDQEDAEN